MYLTAIMIALFPIVAGFLAFITAALIAAYRVAATESAPFVPEYTASETAEWCTDLSLSLDVDAEWIALADAPEAAPRAVRVPAARVAAHLGIAAAAARIVHLARKHAAEATTVDPLPLVSGVKLVKDDRATFLASVRFGIAAATSRRTLQGVLTLASDREWCEAFQASEDSPVESLGTLALLAHNRGDAGEAAAAWNAERAAYLTALREAFASPVITLVTVAA